MPTGSSFVGLSLGIVAALIILYEMLLRVRKVRKIRLIR
jgi:cell division protein ZapA (FtsZ GTPase activity inhibitor)